MSSIITSILSSTIGLLWNKAIDTTAEKLKDGDVTDAQIRKIVVRELNDIQTKLDGLSRKDLLSSYCFLQEGVGLLNVSLDKTKLEPKAFGIKTQDRETSRTSSDGEPSTFNEALELSHAMRKVKIDSYQEFESAKKRFEDARRRATDAFCNEALSVEDRILAAKVRIMSEILECLDSPATAITGCLLFLEKLHSLPAIQEMFSVYLNGGPKSLFNKAERVENVKSVMMINEVLSHHCSKFGSENYSYLAWPVIELADRSFNPVLSWREVSTRKSMGNELIQPPNELILDEEMRPFFSAVNGQGATVVRGWKNDEIKVFSKKGEIRMVKLSVPVESEIIEQSVEGLAVDNNNNVYVFRSLQTRTENGAVTSYVLSVLDENYNLKHNCTLDFLKYSSYRTHIAINKNNDMVMKRYDDPQVYVCDNTGKLKHKFERDSRRGWGLSISGNNEIMIHQTIAMVLKYTLRKGKESQ